jgi:hypothetical protein
MSSRWRPGDDAPADRCAEQRTVAGIACAEAGAATTTYEQAQAHARAVRRDLLVARREQAEAHAAADPARRNAEKAAARDSYRLAQVASAHGGTPQAAVADYARTLDRINRTTLRAQRAVEQADARVDALEQARQQAERAERTARVQCDQARAACLEARIRLADCEERAAPSAGAWGAADPVNAAVPIATLATGPAAPAPRASEAAAAQRDREWASGPTVLDALLDGQRGLLEPAAARLAERAGWSASDASRQLMALIGAIERAAAAAGYLVFDRDHRLWAGLEPVEAHDVVAALGRLGYAYDPAMGWRNGRVPSPADLAMALAYAGLDPRNMRDLPSADEVRALPASMRVDAGGFLASEAQGLTIERLVGALGDEAAQLEPLWSEWGQVRSLLLTDARSLARRVP